jgi:hypothetical protein
MPPAAILSTARFVAGSVDPNTVTLAGAQVARLPNGRLMSSLIDVNGDRRRDLLIFFNIQDLQLELIDTEAVLLGKTLDGKKVRAVDVVRIVDSDALMLISPEDGTTVNMHIPTFEWDGDMDAIYYRIEIDREPNFRFSLAAHNIQPSQCRMEHTIGVYKLVVRVVAFHANGA